DAQSIQQAFLEQGSLFGQQDVFSTEIVLWAFLAQTLRDGKGAACAAAVADIATYMLQTGQCPPCGDTGDYCRARAKLNLTAIQRLVCESAQQLDKNIDPAWLWKGLHAKLVDGFTFTMPDTPANQEQFPQLKAQTPGVGFPIARACTVVSLATACVCDMAIGPFEGKETGEPALLRNMLGNFDKNDLVVFDRYYCSYMMLAMMSGQELHVCARLHQRRPSDFRTGRRLGPDDHLVTWTRPLRPPWMTQEQYAQIPETLELREVRFRVIEPGRRTETITVVTTLTDPEQYSREDIAELYGLRWNVETDILHIKQTLNLDHLRCKTPDMIQRELWVTLLAYNLIRKVIATSAAVHEKHPRRLGFTLACQTVLSAWMLLSTGTCCDSRAMTTMMLAHIADNEVANRPGRIEPRVLKRRRHRYPLMQDPRDQLRAKLGKT
ncbi:MAG: IS4 family transposase, partial [Gemmatimonadales bacterium]|nr:IS4 family transposase [Gemmatimonadales bacterium]